MEVMLEIMLEELHRTVKSMGDFCKSYRVVEDSLIDETIQLFYDCLRGREALLMDFSRAESFLVSHPSFERIETNFKEFRQAINRKGHDNFAQEFDGYCHKLIKEFEENLTQICNKMFSNFLTRDEEVISYVNSEDGIGKEGEE